MQVVIVKTKEYLENGLYLILESKVESLLGKVSDDAGEISAPKTQDAFVVERPTDAIPDAGEPLKFKNRLFQFRERAGISKIENTLVLGHFVNLTLSANTKKLK